MGKSVYNEKEYIIDIIKNVDLSKGDLWEKALILDAVSEAMRMDKDECYKTFLDKELKNAMQNNLADFLIANACYKSGGDMTEIAVNTAKRLKTQPRCEEGYFINEEGNKDLSAAFGILKFYMNYETKHGGKENYNDIIAQFKAMHKDLFESAKERLIKGEKKAFRAMALYAAGLIDTMEVMDQALYEIYAKLREFFKETVVAVSEEINTIEGEDAYKLIFAYAVFKGCRMNVLLTEKHEAAVLGIYENAAKNVADLKNKDMLYKGAFILAYSEFIKNREYQEYGRNRGGVLWN